VTPAVGGIDKAANLEARPLTTARRRFASSLPVGEAGFLYQGVT